MAVGLILAPTMLASCGSDAASTATTTSTTAASSGAGTSGGGSTTTTSGSASGASSVKLADSSLGKIVVDGSGTTRYAFMPDSATKSACNGTCAGTWPPLAAPASPTGAGLDAGDLGTLTRDDGTKQVTFYNHPLYTYAGDSGPGEVTGQGVGGKWYVVDASGKPVKDATDGSTTTPATTPTTTRSGY